MQYLSGVWESLTGQAPAKRKRDGDEAEALPDRMTTLKLFSGQCPGRLHHSAPHSQAAPEHVLLDGNSSTDSDTQSQAGTVHCVTDKPHALAQCNSWDDQHQHPQFKIPPPPQPHSQQHAYVYSNHTGSSCAKHSKYAASVPSSFTGYMPHPYTHTTQSNSESATQPRSAQHSHPGQPHHAFHPGVHRSSGRQQTRSGHRQASAQAALHPPALPAVSDLCCSEVLSPMHGHKAPWQSMAPSPNSVDIPSPDLVESVADSPDDNEILDDDIATSPSNPVPGVLAAFLALCQAPQITTALSKLQAIQQLPCPTSFSLLPSATQRCPVAMSTEFLTAGSLAQEWSKASQLEWTLAGMFALCQRAELDPLELDCIMVLCLLWILESCSSQYNSNLTVVTMNYLAYATAAAAAAGPTTPPEVRNWQQDMKTSQLEVLERCKWRVHLDFEADLVPALKQLQQASAVAQLQTVLRQTESASRHRRAMDAHFAAHRRHHASQAQQAQHTQHAQHVQTQQQMYSLACCQSSTKPP